MPKVVIVGAGISGLALAYRLRQTTPSAEITLLERLGRPGGTVWTERRDGYQVEVGAKQVLPGGWAEWTFSAYQIVKNNLLQPVPGNPTLQQQIGQQSSRGIEASFAVTPIKGLRLEANASILRAKFDSFGENVSGTVISRAGNRPPNIPEKTANAFVTWDVWGPIQVRGQVRAVDRVYYYDPVFREVILGMGCDLRSLLNRYLAPELSRPLGWVALGVVVLSGFWLLRYRSRFGDARQAVAVL